MKKRWLPEFSVFFLAFILYANSLTHGFVLDDSMMIAKNQFTTKGFAGLPGIFSTDMFFGSSNSEMSKELVVGGRYRPMSLAMFAVIYEFFGDKPFVYHLITVLLYALACLILFKTLKNLFKNYKHGQLLATLAALLYTVHPIHSEVVNNVKSCDEILTMLFSLLALFFSLKAAENQSFKWLAAAGISFLLAAFSKENSVVFTAIIPLALAFKFSENSPEKLSVSNLPYSKIVKICLPIWIGFLFFFIVRGLVIHWTFGAAQLNLINNPFIKFNGTTWEHFSMLEKYATIIFCLGKYLLLHVFPHPLTTDYYPRHIGIENFGSASVWISLIVNLGLFFYALIGSVQGKKDPVRFGLFFYFAAIFLASNIIFPVGTNMAERFTFMPSAGICLAIAGLAIAALDKNWINEKTIWIVFSTISIVFSIKVFTRNPDFKDSRTLLFTDVKTSPRSAKLQCSVAGMLIRESMESQDTAFVNQNMRQAIIHLNQSLEYHPTYSEALFARGTAHYFLKNYPAAILDLQKTAQLTPGRSEVIQNLTAAYLDAAKEMIVRGQNIPTAFQFLSQANQLIPNSPDVLFQIALGHLKMGNYQQAIVLLSQLQKVEPGNPEFNEALEKAQAGLSK